MNLLSIFKREPKPPVRMIKCELCHKEVEAPPSWDGVTPQAHILCQMMASRRVEELAREEAERRAQINLIKTAIRELKEDGEL